MRLAIFLCAAALATPVLADELVARRGGDMVRLTDTPCTSQQVLNRIDPESQPNYRAASAILQGQSFVACWNIAGNAAHLLYEDGDEGLIPLEALKPEMST